MGTRLVANEDRMNIVEAVSRIESLSIREALVARPPLVWGAEARFVTLTDDYRVPESIEADGFRYLLGQEDLVRLLSHCRRKRMSREAIAEFLIHFALNDCAPAWFSDLPDR